MFLQRHKTIALFLAAVMLLSLAFSASSPRASADDGLADSTIIVYMIGADLELNYAAGSVDIYEMMTSGFDFAHNNLVVITGGTEYWWMGESNPELDIPNDSLCFLEIEENGFEIADEYYACDMADPDILSSCLDVCVEEFPARSYGLILWDHGGGPMGGYGVDYLFGDMLSMAELVQALDDSPFGPDNKLAFLGFDACMMSSVEVAWLLQDYAEYLIASEELEPGSGWDYCFLGRLKSGPLDGVDVGKHTVETYQDYYLNNSDEYSFRTISLACWDLSYCDQLEEEIDALFSQLSTELAAGAYYELVQSRYEVFPVPCRANGLLDMIDLWDLAVKFAPFCPDETAAIMSTVGQMEKASWFGTDRQHGLSIYFPMDVPEYYLEGSWLTDYTPYREVYADFGFAPVYTAFLEDYAENWGQTSKSYREARTMEIQQQENLYSIQLTEEQAAEFLYGQCEFMIDLEAEEMEMYWLLGEYEISSLDANNCLCVELDGSAPVIITHEADLILPVFNYDFQTGTYYMYALLSDNPDHEQAIADEDSVWVVIQAAAEDPEVPVTLSSCMLLDENMEIIGKSNFSLTEYAYITFFDLAKTPTNDEDGNLLPAFNWDDPSDGLLSNTYPTDIGFEFVVAPLTEANLKLCVQLIAYSVNGDTIVSELIPVK